jgi:hypothetical protein
MTYGTASVKSRHDYRDSKTKIGNSANRCRYCKSARTRSGDPGKYCKSVHAFRSRMLYVTSPVSETYWAS